MCATRSRSKLRAGAAEVCFAYTCHKIAISELELRKWTDLWYRVKHLQNDQNENAITAWRDSSLSTGLMCRQPQSRLILQLLGCYEAVLSGSDRVILRAQGKVDGFPKRLRWGYRFFKPIATDFPFFAAGGRALLKSWNQEMTGRQLIMQSFDL